MFRTLRQCLKDVERLCRFSHRRPEWELQHSKPGFCSLCQEEIATALDIHRMNVHLELGQLLRCPVEWCTLWKGSVSDCLGHMQDKHGGSQYMAVKNLSQYTDHGYFFFGCAIIQCCKSKAQLPCFSSMFSGLENDQNFRLLLGNSMVVMHIKFDVFVSHM